MKWKVYLCYVLFAGLVLLNIYDTYSTNVLLTSGKGFYEANPVMQFSMDIFGILGGMIIFKGVLLAWIASFIIRAKTERMWNILTVGLIICVNWYAVGMYFLNYQAMSFLGGLV